MKKKTSPLPWISILIALASAVGIYFLPEYHLWFLAILLVNLLLPFFAKKSYGDGTLFICRFLVGALFIFSSFTKGIDPLGTKYKMLDYLSAYGMTWLNNAALVLAMVLILAEFIVGFCLITKIFPRLAVLGATLLMLFFTFTTLFDALYNLVPDCGCFGSAIKMTNWQTFYKNLVIDAVLIPLILNNKRLDNHLGKGLQFLIGLAFAAAFLGFEIYNYRHLPVIDFMNWKVGRQLNAEAPAENKVYVTYRNKATRETQEYLSPNYPWNDSVWMSQWEFVGQRTEGGNDYLGFTALDEDGNDVTDLVLNTENLLMFTSSDLSKVTEKDWEKMRQIAEAAATKDYVVLWTVAAEPEEVEQLRAKYDFVYDVYLADDLEIKTIVRSNPGLIWLDNGLVKDKWSVYDFSKALKAF